ANLIVLLCDATCLERGLHLLKQVLSLPAVHDRGTPVILCVNLWDEARKKGIETDLSLLQDVLQIPVLPSCARSKKDLDHLRQVIRETSGQRFCYDCLDFSPRQLAAEAVRFTRPDYRRREEIIDRLVTGPVLGPLIMLLLLFGVFWLSM